LGLDIRLSAPPTTSRDAAAVQLAVECGVWDSYWGVPGFPFDPGLRNRVHSTTGTPPKRVSWPGKRSDSEHAEHVSWWSSSKRSPTKTPRHIIRHDGVALLMYRHTWVSHFGHNLLHNFASITETFYERGLLHLLDGSRASFVALDMAATGGKELPPNLLNTFFRQVISASELPLGEEHCFERALLGQAHRHMLHMSVFATPPRTQRKVYRAMGRLLERHFCGSARAPCVAPPPMAALQSHSSDCAMPPASVLLLVRCSLQDVRKGRCPNEDPTGHSGRRALLNEEDVVAALQTASAGGSVRRENPGRLPLSEQVQLFRSSHAVVGASGSALIGMFFMEPRAVVVELLSFQGTSEPDTTWHELGVSLDLTYSVLHETRWFGRTRRPWDRREAIYVETEQLVDIVRCGLVAARGCTHPCHPQPAAPR
jgi:hypothetical protein